MGLVSGTLTIIWLVAAVGSLLLWAVAAVYQWLLYRVEPVPPGPLVGQPPGDEPPAIVSFITQGWVVTDDAPEATLVDLAARGYLEFQQLGGDPFQTTIHLRSGPARGAEPGLLPFEQSVLDRVAHTAVDGVAPVRSLQDRGGRQWARWRARFEKDLVAEARRRGLTRPGGFSVWTIVVGAAGVAAGGFVALAAADFGLGWGVGLATLAVAVVAHRRLPRHRDTVAGREVAARWLGFRAYLDSADAFRAESPAAVAIWDRVLAYGTALGANVLVADVINFGPGDDRRIWSSYGGTWRPVTISYPGWIWRGRTLPGIVGYATIHGVAALWFASGALILSRGRVEVPPSVDPGLTIGLGTVAVLLSGRALWLVGRAVVDAASTVTLSGEVLRVAIWRTTGDEDPSPISYYLAVDDGIADHTVAWCLRAQTQRAVDVHPHDVVQLRARPWSRVVRELTVLRSAPAQVAPDPADTTGAASNSGQSDRVLRLAEALLARAAPPVVLTGSDGAVVERWNGLFPRGDAAVALAEADKRLLSGVKPEGFVGSDWAYARDSFRWVFIRLPGIGSWSDHAIAQRLDHEFKNWGRRV